MTKYPQILLDYFHHLEHAGTIPSARNVLIAEEGTEQQGEIIRLYLAVSDDIITDANFKSFGSVALIAGCEFICRWLEGKSIKQALEITPEYILKELQLTSYHKHIAVLIVQTVKAVLQRDL